MNSHMPAILLSIIIAIGIFFGYISPTWNGAIAQTKASIVSDDTALAAAASFAASQKKLQDAEDSITPDNMARLTKMLPDSVNNIGLIIDLDALAAKSGLSISSIDVAASSGNTGSSGSSDSSSASPGGSGMGSGSSAPTSLTSSLDVSMSAAGSYTALKTFLNGVETSQRLLDVTDLTVSGSDTGVYTYAVKLRIYWLN